MATTARDPRVVRAALLLRDEEARREEGAFVLDEEGLLAQALAAGIEVEWVLAAEPERLAAGLAGAAAVRGLGAPPPHIAPASPDALRALAALGQAPSVVAVCRIPPEPPAGDLPPRSLVLARVRGAGNVGSIVRTAAAFGLPRVALTPGSADPWSRPALRAAKGATFAPGLVATRRDLHGAALFAAVPRGGIDPAQLPRNARVVLGAERDGLTADEVARCAGTVTIPAPGFESLNVAAAAAIVTYELARRA